ncbi:hypothetical protein GPROT1_02157 [Gammaproteobacteria bacterium]|jgi:hypothetical protein|nr:hypothetical protein GPROT1_02157 [Gammaproteobacteria bacterium]
MGLSGTFSDLTLGDLLQILAVARKSGMLEISSPAGEGWILLQAGQVGAAAAKGGPCEALAPDAGPVEPGREATEALRRDGAEQAVLRMLGWRGGGFRVEFGPPPPWVAASGLLLEQPIPSEYLALEGVRMQDEAAALAANALVDRVLEEVDGTPAREPEAPLRVPLVVIDPDLGALEWLKRTLSDGFERVHVLQRTELAVTRIRQYLARGERPVVLVSRDARPDPVSGIRDSAELVSRLHQQAPRMPIVLLVARDGASGRMPLRKPLPHGLAAVVTRPSVDVIEKPAASEAVERCAAALRDEIRRAIEPKEDG